MMGCGDGDGDGDGESGSITWWCFGRTLLTASSKPTEQRQDCEDGDLERKIAKAIETTMVMTI